MLIDWKRHSPFIYIIIDMVLRYVYLNYLRNSNFLSVYCFLFYILATSQALYIHLKNFMGVSYGFIFDVYTRCEILIKSNWQFDFIDVCSHQMSGPVMTFWGPKQKVKEGPLSWILLWSFMIVVCLQPKE